ncbi:MAG: restriction endonuclease, SacI family [Candidatus Acidiferrales bacterium]
MLGCVLVRLTDRSIDIHKPYVNLGKGAYNGRSLDEKVINPFLHEKRIPSSRGPFLAVFRRSVRFGKATRGGTKDKKGYDSFVALIDLTSQADDGERLKELLRYLLFRFICLRTAADIPLSKLHRISLEQYDQLIEGLLSTPSGGRFPVLLVEATFTAIKRAYSLDWTIEVQGINVADRATGVGGDITIRQGQAILLAVEVTERPVERSRVMSTFQTKIAPQGIEDYLFLVRGETSEDVMRQARQYFSQGHEVNFLEIKSWILMVLATLGKAGRAIFSEVVLAKLDDPEVPAELKLAWNTQIDRITTAQ